MSHRSYTQATCVKVIVFGEDTLSGSYTVNPAGDLIMPLIGSVRAAGLTRLELQQRDHAQI